MIQSPRCYISEGILNEEMCVCVGGGKLGIRVTHQIGMDFSLDKTIFPGFWIFHSNVKKKKIQMNK